ncbi:MAG: hypothetical protein R3C31_05960 [Hyphomonadaceae bacterium]
MAQAVVREADLAELSRICGCGRSVKPRGYGTWERDPGDSLPTAASKKAVTTIIISLPDPTALSPRKPITLMALLKEIAVVTHHRLKNIDGSLKPDPEAELAEPFIRPTSETIIGDAFSRWVKSYRICYQLNQWANAMRWEITRHVPANGGVSQEDTAHTPMKPMRWMRRWWRRNLP